MFLIELRNCFEEKIICWKITPVNVRFDSIERLVRRITRWEPGAILVIYDPSKEILNERLQSYSSCILLPFLAKMKRANKYSKGGLLLNVIRAGAFYLFRYIKHAIRNEIVFVWTIRHVWILFISADVSEERPKRKLFCECWSWWDLVFRWKVPSRL